MIFSHWFLDCLCGVLEKSRHLIRSESLQQQQDQPCPKPFSLVVRLPVWGLGKIGILFGLNLCSRITPNVSHWFLDAPFSLSYESLLFPLPFDTLAVRQVADESTHQFPIKTNADNESQTKTASIIRQPIFLPAPTLYLLFRRLFLSHYSIVA